LSLAAKFSLHFLSKFYSKCVASGILTEKRDFFEHITPLEACTIKLLTAIIYRFL
jgi:hypothetical protein